MLCSFAAKLRSPGQPFPLRQREWQKQAAAWQLDPIRLAAVPRCVRGPICTDAVCTTGTYYE